VVATAARNALDIRYAALLRFFLLLLTRLMMRYRLLDYLYTAFHQQHIHGTPVLSPLWFAYPSDANTFGLDLQFLFGSSVLVSPVTEENATSVSAYLPRDILYDFTTLAPVHGRGSYVQLQANFTTIPLHIRGGVVLPLRASGAMTTAQLRKTDFELIVAPGTDGTAAGALYVDDGESITPPATTNVKMSSANGRLNVSGSFGYSLGVNVARVRVLGVSKAPKTVTLAYGGKTTTVMAKYKQDTQVLDVPVGMPFDKAFTVTMT
jgi:alpha-glucosidase